MEGLLSRRPAPYILTRNFIGVGAVLDSLLCFVVGRSRGKRLRGEFGAVITVVHVVSWSTVVTVTSAVFAVMCAVVATSGTVRPGGDCQQTDGQKYQQHSGDRP